MKRLKPEELLLLLKHCGHPEFARLKKEYTKLVNEMGKLAAKHFDIRSYGGRLDADCEISVGFEPKTRGQPCPLPLWAQDGHGPWFYDGPK